MAAQRELLPYPAAAVVGDFGEDAPPFASQAWERITEAYAKLGRPFGDSRAWTARSSPPKGLPNRAEAQALLPIRIDDENNSASAGFRQAMRAAMVNFDVWVVIACTTSRNTVGLLEVLEVADVPILLAVDSALSGIEMRPNIVRLIPSNVQQAQAIAAKVRELREAHGLSAVEAYCAPSDDRYVRDLRNTLREELDPGFEATSDPKALRGVGVLVCIGYREAFFELLAAGKVGKALILSDGLFGDHKVLESVKQGAAGSRVYWCHSKNDPATYAEQGYRASCQVWTAYGRRTSGTIEDGLKETERMRPFVRLVGDKLEEYATPFLFRGQENLRGTFVVERLQSHTKRPSGPRKLLVLPDPGSRSPQGGDGP